MRLQPFLPLDRLHAKSVCKSMMLNLDAALQCSTTAGQVAPVENSLLCLQVIINFNSSDHFARRFVLACGARLRPSELLRNLKPEFFVGEEGLNVGLASYSGSRILAFCHRVSGHFRFEKRPPIENLGLRLCRQWPS